MSACRGRHRFTIYGLPGLRTPFCVRCGVPNPRPLTEQQRREYDDYVAELRRLTKLSAP